MDTLRKESKLNNFKSNNVQFSFANIRDLCFNFIGSESFL